MAEVDFVIPPFAPGVSTGQLVDYYRRHDVPFMGELRPVVHAELAADGGLRLRVHVPDEVLRERLADVPADRQACLNVVWEG
jgi:hypothetical protein